MANEDLSRLKIDKSQGIYRARRSRKVVYLAGALFIILVIILLSVSGVFTPAVQVEVANVTRIYPSQTFTLLNASGYVVAQRKAAGFEDNHALCRCLWRKERLRRAGDCAAGRGRR
jgi:hypothetical protein